MPPLRVNISRRLLYSKTTRVAMVILRLDPISTAWDTHFIPALAPTMRFMRHFIKEKISNVKETLCWKLKL